MKSFSLSKERKTMWSSESKTSSWAIRTPISAPFLTPHGRKNRAHSIANLGEGDAPNEADQE